MKINSKQVKKFNENGFIIYKSLLSRKEIEKIFSQLNLLLNTILIHNNIKFKKNFSIEKKYFLLKKKKKILKSKFYDCIRILDSFKKDVHIVNNIKNNGLPTSLNKIIKKIKTKYFVRVDADDYVSVYFLQYLFNFMTKNNHIDAIACDYNLIDDNERLLSRKNCMKEPIACGILFKTKQIIDIGLYDESFQIWEEKDLRIRFLEKYSIYRLELPLYRYRKHESNITNNKKESDYFMNKLNLKHKKK